MGLFRLNESKCSGNGCVGPKNVDSTGNPKAGLYKVSGEYDSELDARFIGAGEDPEIAKVNIPSLLAAKTAGGAPFAPTAKNGINEPSPSVFKIKDNN